MSDPLISVVIPTRGRPLLVTRAVHSALRQTFDRFEVIVVIDGPDEATRDALRVLADPRLRVIQLGSNGGACAARNRGAEAARGEWIALLDDDDEWLPDKLDAQMQLARSSVYPEPVVAARSIVRTPRGEFVLPRRLPRRGEPVGDYMFIRHGLFHGDGFVQTSTILARRELLLRIPFDERLERWHETDWIIRCGATKGFGLEVASEPLAIWHADEDRPRVSADGGWQASFQWIRRNRPLLSERAYAAALMSVISDTASLSGDPRVFRVLWREAARNGSPALIDYLTFFRIWAVPRWLRRSVRDRIMSRLAPPAGGPAAGPHGDRPVGGFRDQ